MSWLGKRSDMVKIPISEHKIGVTHGDNFWYLVCFRKGKNQGVDQQLEQQAQQCCSYNDHEQQHNKPD